MEDEYEGRHQVEDTYDRYKRIAARALVDSIKPHTPRHSADEEES